MSTDPQQSLQEHIERAFRAWQEEHGLSPSVPVAWVLAVEGAGFQDDLHVEHMMLVPGASATHILGLLEHAKIQMTDIIRGVEQ